MVFEGEPAAELHENHVKFWNSSNVNQVIIGRAHSLGCAFTTSAFFIRIIIMKHRLHHSMYLDKSLVKGGSNSRSVTALETTASSVESSG